MAVAYTTRSQIEEANVGIIRLEVLLDRNKDGVEDAGTLDAVILDAASLIDARLAQRYRVPFAAVTSTPPTPDIINLICRHLVLWQLYEYFEPDGPDAQYHFQKADSLMTGILRGTFSIPGVPLLPADEGQRQAAFSASTPRFTGRKPNGQRRMRGM